VCVYFCVEVFASLMCNSLTHLMNQSVSQSSIELVLLLQSIWLTIRYPDTRERCGGLISLCVDCMQKTQLFPQFHERVLRNSSYSPTTSIADKQRIIGRLHFLTWLKSSRLDLSQVTY